MNFDLAQTDELLATTRAVRKRLDFERTVPRAIVNECIALSQQAPTGGNSQGWRWIVVEDADKRRFCAQSLFEICYSRTSHQAGQRFDGHRLARPCIGETYEALDTTELGIGVALIAIETERFRSCGFAHYDHHDQAVALLDVDGGG